MRKFFWSVGIGSLVLGGCTSIFDPVPYQEMGIRGGVKHNVTDDGIHEVNARGNGVTSHQRVVDYAYLKAAEVTRDDGGACFLLLDEDIGVKQAYASGASIPYSVVVLRFNVSDNLNDCEDYDANLIYNELAPLYIND